jgi:hypothetical protein
MHSMAQQYDDTRWQALQRIESGSQSGAEGVPEIWDTPDAQLLTESALYNTFGVSQPLPPTEYEAPSDPLNDLQPHAYITPWTDDQSLQVDEHLQSLTTQLPGLPIENQFVTQSFMNDNSTTRQRRQVLEDVPELQTEFSLEMGGDRFYQTNQYLHPNTEVSTLEYGRRYIDFSTPLTSDAVSHVAPTMSNSANLDGAVPKFWSISPLWWAPFDPSSSSDPSQKLNIPNFNPGPFQDRLEYHPTQLQHSSDVATSLGSSSRHVQGFRPETPKQMYQISSLGLPHYRGIGKQTFC